MNVRHDGKYLTNDDYKVTSHISGLFYKNINLLSNNITPIYIFDGKPPDEKYEVIKLRQERAKVAKTEFAKHKQKTYISCANTFNSMHNMQTFTTSTLNATNCQRMHTHTHVSLSLYIYIHI